MTPRTCSIPDCGEPHCARGWCKKHYSRAERHNGDPLAGNTAKGEPLTYFIAHLGDTGPECVIWPYAKTHDGYGYLTLPEHPLHHHDYVHTLSCLVRYGLPPFEPMEAAHAPVICHQRACFNADHLRWATRAEQVDDMHLDGTHRAGERSTNAKLNWSAVDAIRARHATGDVSQAALGREFGVGQSTIQALISGRTWKPENRP